jgi:hypothetical protein
VALFQLEIMQFATVKVLRGLTSRSVQEAVSLGVISEATTAITSVASSIISKLQPKEAALT